jgi:hypothetical protein
MAIMRCKLHSPSTSGTSRRFRGYAKPVGYPNTAAICGKEGCEAPARLWLSDAEMSQYERGARIFIVRTYSARIKIRVQGGLFLREEFLT